MAGLHGAVRLDPLNGFPRTRRALHFERFQVVVFFARERSAAKHHEFPPDAGLALVLRRLRRAVHARGGPRPAVNAGAQNADAVFAAAVQRDFVVRQAGDLAKLSLHGRGARHARVRPRVFKVHEERRASDWDDFPWLAEVVVPDVDSVPPRTGHGVVHLMQTVVGVHQSHGSGARLRVVVHPGDFHHEVVPPGRALGVARVLR
mmetsp:Transcript_7534/g.28325  ORF Transcript_7534/g.28325 Transcript_7534/m.28325 type:complete len:204 (+) Transcript_7534:13009-13620(+)